MTGSLRQVKPAPQIELVYFDAGGTLLDPYPSVGAVYQRAGAPFGLTASADALQGAFKRVWRGYTEVALDDPYRMGRDVQSTRDWWRGLVFEVFRVLDWQPEPNVQEACFDAFFAAFERPEAWRVYDDVLPTLKALADRGVGAGLLSNWDYRLPKLLEDLDLRGRFSPELISAFEGLAKPDPAFFRLAVERSGLPPHKIAYVGDRRSLDLVPALEVGMDAYLIQRGGAPEERTITRLTSMVPDPN